MSNGPESLSDLTELAQKELEDAYSDTFDDRWLEKAKSAHGTSETLAYMRRLETAVMAARAKELQDIVSGMQANETELRAALGDVEQAKQDVDDIAGNVRAVTKVLGVFEKVLDIVT